MVENFKVENKMKKLILLWVVLFGISVTGANAEDDKTVNFSPDAITIDVNTNIDDTDVDFSPGISLRAYEEMYIKLYENTVGAVVGVYAMMVVPVPMSDSTYGKYFKDSPNIVPKAPATVGQGTGYIVEENGIVITNHHVIQEDRFVLDELYVFFEDKRYFKAKILGSDPLVDIAILQIIPWPADDRPEYDKTSVFGFETNKFPVLKHADSDKLKVGSHVFAIGNPLGQNFSMTAGIVSAVDREFRSGPWLTYIQTDTALNKGNSGGPLLNLDGEVVGTNARILSLTGMNVGISYAIPSNTVEDVIEDLLDDGVMHRPYIGVSMATPDVDTLAIYDLEENDPGVLIMNVVEDAPAHKAGLKDKDLVIQIDGAWVHMEGFHAAIQMSNTGDKLVFRVLRQDEKDDTKIDDIDITIVVGEQPLVELEPFLGKKE